MDRIALAGHSRGGEAVGQAAAFNRLSRYPDDANVMFDFNFNIRSIIAIAPVDGQYKPADRLVPLENINYLVFHGSHDGDVSSFMGLRQYQRVRFTDGKPYFKSAVLVYQANHGQWNTVWGARDNGVRSARILDLRTLMPSEEQRQFAKVYMSAFLDATLRGDARYLPMFRDYRLASNWLPKTMYITRFEESSFRPIADFEGDVDVTTGSVPEVRIEGEHLSTWKESLLQLRTGTAGTEASSTYNNVVTLGWNNKLAGTDDPPKIGPPATFTVKLPPAVTQQFALGTDTALQLLLIPTDVMPGPRRPPGEDKPAEKDAEAKKKAGAKPPPKKKPEPKPKKDEEKPPVDLSIELTDVDGRSAKVALSAYGIVRRPLEAWILRRRDLDQTRFPQHAESVLQTYSIPLADFVKANADLKLGSLSSIRFVFDRAEAGTVLIDDIGFARLSGSSPVTVTP